MDNEEVAKLWLCDSQLNATDQLNKLEGARQDGGASDQSVGTKLCSWWGKMALTCTVIVP